MKPALRYIRNVFIGIVILSLFLFGLLWGLLQIPSVQQWTVHQITEILENQFQSEVRIERVDIDFFKTAVLEGIYIEDQQQDTLLYANRLAVNIGLISLTQQVIALDQVELSGARIKLQQSTDSLFNYQFLLGATTEKNAQEETNDSTVSSWDFSIGQLALSDTRFTLDDQLNEYGIETNIDQLSVSMEEMDVNQNRYHVSQIDLQNSVLLYQVFAIDTSTISAPASWPEIPVELSVDQISMNDNTLIYEVLPIPRVANTFDPNHLRMTSISADIEAFVVGPERIQADLKRCALQEQSGLTVQGLKGGVLLTPNQLDLKDLSVQTTHSTIAAQATVEYDSFELLTAFDPTLSLEMDLGTTQLSQEDLRLFAPEVVATLQAQGVPSQPLQVSGKLSGSLQELDLKQVKLDGFSLVKAALNAKIGGLPKVEQLTYQTEFQSFYIPLKKWTPFLPNPQLKEALEFFEEFQIQGRLAGDMNEIRGTNLKINTKGSTRFSGDLEMRNLQEPSTLRFDLNIGSLETKAEELAYFIPSDTLQRSLDVLGGIQFSGVAKGSLKMIDLDGLLNTDIGQLRADTQVDFNADYSDATYGGKINLDRFDLGTLLQDTASFGLVSLDLDLQGAGITPEALKGEVEAKINQFTFNQYDYRDITLEGLIDQLKFEGRVRIDDSNIRLSLNGMLSLEDTIPHADFELQVDTLQLASLNLTTEAANLSGILQANLSGRGLNDVEGDLTMNNFYFGNPLGYYQTDSIKLIAAATAFGKNLEIQSDIMQASLQGNYELEALPNLLLDFVNDYFPVDSILSSEGRLQPLAVEPNQHFDFELKVNDPIPLTQLFIPTLTQLDQAAVVATFNAKEKDWKLSGSVPDLVYGGVQIDSVSIYSKGDLALIQNQIRFKNIQVEGIQPISTAGLDLLIGDQQINQRLFVLAKNGETKFSTGGQLTASPDFYSYQFTTPLILNNEQWEVREEHSIDFRSNYLNIDQVRFSKEKQVIYLDSDEQSSADLAPIKLGFQAFQLDEVSTLINFEDAFYKGNLNGEIILNDYANDLHFLADLVVKDIVLNEDPVGDLSILANQEGSNDLLNVEVALNGEQNEMQLDGAYSISESTFDVTADLKRLELRLADAFSSGQIRSSQGFLSGQAKIFGSLDKINIDGTLKTNGISTGIAYLNQRYALEDSAIQFDEEQINLGTIQMTDSIGNIALLSGRIQILDPQNPALDLQFKTDRFTVLNTGPEVEELFYGQLIVELDTRIKGTLDKPKVEVRKAKTLDGTRLTVQDLETGDLLDEKRFIIFANPSDYQEDTTQTIDQAYSIEYLGVDLLLNLELTDEALLEVIVDPISGDKLTIQGNADLTIDMNAAGVLNVTGNYLISSGQYSFSYEGLVSRKFNVEKGSRLVFVGDPLQTRFDIAASYTSKTSLYPLIKNQSSLSEEETCNAQRRSDVYVYMLMKGNIDQPEISFDIRLPSEQGGLTTSTASRKIAQIRQNETELNKQVFGLLLFNNFFADASSSSRALSTAGESLALSSVSNLLSSQLNDLADKYVKGIDITFGLESYKSQFINDGTGGGVTELQVGISRQLFNDRLTIQVGGNINVEGEGSSGFEDAGFSDIAGDFVLSYKLTPKGNYRLRVFRKSNFDVLQQENNNRAGVGLLFTKSFGDKTKKVKQQLKQSNEEKKN